MCKLFVNTFIIFYLCLFTAVTQAHSPSETATAHFFQQIVSNEKALTNFLQRMPKGADLHIHMTGATYAENMLDYAYSDSLCVDRKTYIAYKNDQCEPQDFLNFAVQDNEFRETLIDKWSMRHFQENAHENSHDHFFASFKKFEIIPKNHTGEVLTEIVERAANQQELYLELMVSHGSHLADELGKKIQFDPNFETMRQQLLTNELANLTGFISTQLDNDEAILHNRLHCNTDNPMPACNLQVRYLLRAERTKEPRIVFAQLLAAFETAKQDKRIVGVNLVQAEDDKNAMRDYTLHMHMLRYFNKIYPDVSVSLHAGELTESLVGKAGLTSHIHEAVFIAKAKRIGHGVDIAQEHHSDELLKKMANKHVLVEVNLTSNDQILGVKNEAHPFPLYLKAHIPVTLSTDDEGVSRINLTHEYFRAVESYHLDYHALKIIARNSIHYAFIPGQALWLDYDYQQPITACANDTIGQPNPSPNCSLFLQANEKAALQWELEKRFNQFELPFVRSALIDHQAHAI